MNRGQAWRRAKDAAKAIQQERLAEMRAERRPGADSWKDAWVEKNWKHMAGRTNKAARAKQLGFDYPRKTDRELLDEAQAETI